ncbi:alpha/beta fold hydrolase [Streptomonospora nanhaiensis]|uniref:Pimeloyl-ACP methyl ester carboxylesterase n=1 Tax=Streptomonospora nanhaiensis TaxID=1323731 RepID=A0A853BI15_9ACTN|nr:alpha/beta hydrolase [Streptomonospora nanhaiensis]MBV2366400.1 alpha/beta hydrolase [Streptomonospora nanhaiensis]NYI94217.1 pimeloyl-ACP methyl ester carboxylesterase [Streptomonospora nanhaiensis]
MTAAPRRTTVLSPDGTRINVEVHGPDDAPAIVLSHGWTCSTHFWRPVAEHLGTDHRVVCYDQRGHGASSHPRRHGYSVAALADDLCAVLEAVLGPEERAVVGGHSMGAMTIMAAADRPRFARRAAAVLLASTGSTALPASSRVLPGAARFPRLGAAAHRLLLGSMLPLGPLTPLTRAALHYVTMAPDADPAMVDYCARIVHACAPVARGRWGKVLAHLELDRGLAHLDMPSVVVAGTRDRLTPIAQARHIRGLLPNCERFIEVTGAGHMTPLEAPETVAGALADLAAAHLRTPVAHREETA